MTIATVIYEGSDGAATLQFYRRLASRGPIGFVAVNLFRAQKCSARAKKYRGGLRGIGSYRELAYEKKNWSLKQLCEALVEHGTQIGMTWGWKVDPWAPHYEWVLYVDLPQGQVSFHSAARYGGPDYVGEWDGTRASRERIIAFADDVLEKTIASTQEAEDDGGARP